MSLRKEKKLVREFVDFQAACKNFVKTGITEKKLIQIIHVLERIA